jgi:hypothetical protein
MRINRVHLYSYIKEGESFSFPITFKTPGLLPFGAIHTTFPPLD